MLEKTNTQETDSSQSLRRLTEALDRAGITDPGVWAAMGFLYNSVDDLEDEVAGLIMGEEGSNENQTHHR